MKFHKKNLLGIGISEANKEEVLEYIITSLERNTEKYFIFTPNPELLVVAQRDLRFKNALNKADLALPDGVGVIIAGKLLKLGFKGRITGVDLVENLCRRVAEKPITVGFLGGRSGVAVGTAECLRKKYPGLKVGFVGEEWENPIQNSLPARLRKAMQAGKFKIQNSKTGFDSKLNSSVDGHALGIKDNDKNPTGFPQSQKFINHIDILFVAFGSPKQELWITENLNRLPVKVAIGVGGSFDFLSGRVKRAPTWIQKAGFEWLFRLILQPWRIKRQLRLPKFVFLVLAQKFGKKFN